MGLNLGKKPNKLEMEEKKPHSFKSAHFLFVCLFLDGEKRLRVVKYLSLFLNISVCLCGLAKMSVAQTEWADLLLTEPNLR